MFSKREFMRSLFSIFFCLVTCPSRGWNFPCQPTFWSFLPASVAPYRCPVPVHGDLEGDGVLELARVVRQGARLSG